MTTCSAPNLRLAAYAADSADIAAVLFADILTIIVAVAVGMLTGELVGGIPLSRRIARYERRKRAPFPDVDDLDKTIIAERPDDRAAALLEAWRTERARRDLHAMGQAADIDSGRLRRR